MSTWNGIERLYKVALKTTWAVQHELGMVSRDATKLDNRHFDEMSKGPQNLVRIQISEYQSHLVGKFF